MAFPKVSFPATWGKTFNLSNGKVVVDDDTFSLVPNAVLTAMIGSLGDKAYNTRNYPIWNITGYQKVFMAWMKILFSDGTELKVSIGTDSKKRKLIAALEERRAAIFAAAGDPLPPLTATI